MHKKTELIELDFPKDDIECWWKYPRHRWVYDLSRLLDAQNIYWSPYQISGTIEIPNIKLSTLNNEKISSGIIYIKEPTGACYLTEVFISRGEIKHMRHIDHTSKQELLSLNGEIELKLSAFVSIYFSKFTGIISVRTVGNQIYRIILRSSSELTKEDNELIIKKAKRIYKKTEITLNGLEDRITHETL